MGELLVVVCLSLGWWDIANGLKQPMVVEPSDPFERGKFDRLPGLPRCPTVNQLGFVQPVDGLGQRVVIAVATAANGWFDACLSQALGVAMLTY
jgi:hypothetical protein